METGLGCWWPEWQEASNEQVGQGVFSGNRGWAEVVLPNSTPRGPVLVPYQGFSFSRSLNSEELNAFCSHWCLLQHIPNAVMLHVALGWGVDGQV